IVAAAAARGAEAPSVWLDRGHCRAEQDQLRDAAADFARAAAMGVRHLEPLQALALLAAGDRAGYRTVATRILDFLNTKAQPSDPIELLVWPLVLPAGETPDLSKSIALLEQVVTPKCPDAMGLRTLGAALLRAGKPREAIRRLEEGCKMRSENFPSAWLLLALAHHRAGSPADAKKWFDRAANWLDDPDSDYDLEWSDRLKVRL